MDNLFKVISKYPCKKFVFKIKSFFFITSSFITGKPNLLEVYRYFRLNYFNNIDNFYNEFYKNIDKDLENFFNLSDKEIQNKKKTAPFYSISDIKFRLVRNRLLKRNEYENIMTQMFKSKNFNPEDFYSILY